MNISGLPPEIKNLVLSNLGQKDLNTVRSVSKEIKQLTDNIDKAKVLKEIQFIDRFGTLSSKEKESVCSINNLGNKLNSIQRIGNILTHEKHAAPFLLAFENGQFKITLLKSVVSNDNLSEENDSEMIKTIASNIRQELTNLFNNHVQAIKELTEQPYDQGHPAQDYRNRMVRLQGIEKERNIFFNALKEQSKSLVCIEKEGPFLQSLFNPSIEKELENFPLPITSSEFNKKGIILGSTTIKIDGKNVPLRVNLHAERFQSYRHLFISIYATDTEKLIGMFQIRRYWIDENVPKPQAFLEQDLSDRKCDIRVKLTSYKIEMAYSSRIGGYIDLDLNTDYQDPDTGDFPVARMILQLIAEIAEREPAENITIPHYDFYHPMLLSTAGYYNCNPELFHSAHQRAMESRQGNNKKLYPNMIGNPEQKFEAYLYMKDLGEGSPTRFYTRDEMGKPQPAMVEFELDGTKRTWEEEIALHPILKPGSGPVLWGYWTK